MINILTLTIFLIIGFINILSESFLFKKGRYLTKPLLMPLLIIFYLTSEENINFLVIIALVCGFSGDVFLLFTKKESNVLLGIGSFLIGHIFYIIIFIQSINLNLIPTIFFLMIVPYLLIGYVLLKILYKSMDKLKIPGSIYMGIILVMSFFSFTRVLNLPLLNFLLPFFGSLFFILSDTILAIDMFIKSSKYNNVLVMSTYIFAQFLIVLGLIL